MDSRTVLVVIVVMMVVVMRPALATLDAHALQHLKEKATDTLHHVTETLHRLTQNARDNIQHAADNIDTAALARLDLLNIIPTVHDTKQHILHTIHDKHRNKVAHIRGLKEHLAAAFNSQHPVVVRKIIYIYE